MNDEQIKEAQGLIEKKCAIEGCWNYKHNGYVYCSHCMHGSPSVMPKEDFDKIKGYRKYLTEVNK